MTPAVLCVPQWHGSGARDARRLRDGARATAALLPDSKLAEALILDTGSLRRDGVENLDALIANLEQTRTALRSLPVGPVITAGGDCGVELAPVGAASARYGESLTVLWLDAHADLNTPQSSPSGSFHGMVLRTLLGEGPAELVPESPLRPSQVILAGVRALDPPEADFVLAAGLRLVSVSALPTLRGLTGPLYVHIDLDVLDPACFGGISCKEAGGVSDTTLSSLLSSLSGCVGASIVEHAPDPGRASRDAEVLRTLIKAFRFSPA